MATTRRDGAARLSRYLRGRGSQQTKTEIALLFDLSIEQLRHLETGRRKPTLAQACALEDYAEIPIRSWL